MQRRLLLSAAVAAPVAIPTGAPSKVLPQVPVVAGGGDNAAGAVGVGVVRNLSDKVLQFDEAACAGSNITASTIPSSTMP